MIRDNMYKYHIILRILYFRTIKIYFFITLYNNYFLKMQSTHTYLKIQYQSSH